MGRVMRLDDGEWNESTGCARINAIALSYLQHIELFTSALRLSKGRVVRPRGGACHRHSNSGRLGAGAQCCLRDEGDALRMGEEAGRTESRGLTSLTPTLSHREMGQSGATRPRRLAGTFVWSFSELRCYEMPTVSRAASMSFGL